MQKEISDEETIEILSGVYSAPELLGIVDKTQQTDIQLRDRRPTLPKDKTFIQHYPTITAWNKNKEIMDSTNKASDDENDDFILHSSTNCTNQQAKRTIYRFIIIGTRTRSIRLSNRLGIRSKSRPQTNPS